MAKSLAIGSLMLLLSALPATVHGQTCPTEGLLLRVGLDPVMVYPAKRIHLGEWNLPASNPNFITDAKVRLDLVRSGRKWLVEFKVSFDSDKPLGLPFHFQMARISWGEDQFAEIDWSQSCSQIGRTIFPNSAAWTEVLQLPGVGVPADIRNLELMVWGSQN